MILVREGEPIKPLSVEVELLEGTFIELNFLETN